MKLLTTPFKTHIKLNERSQRQWEAEEAERTTLFKAHAIVLTELSGTKNPKCVSELTAKYYRHPDKR